MYKDLEITSKIKGIYKVHFSDSITEVMDKLNRNDSIIYIIYINLILKTLIILK